MMLASRHHSQRDDAHALDKGNIENAALPMKAELDAQGGVK